MLIALALSPAASAQPQETTLFKFWPMGAVPGPFDTWITLRGLKTLALRMGAHERNAGEVARFLEGHAAVREVLYPGLPGHPGREVQAGQASGFGGIVSFRVKGGRAAACRVCSATRFFLLAESLGGVESLVDHPVSMTHGAIPREERIKAGFHDGLIRLSVGVEGLMIRDGALAEPIREATIASTIQKMLTDVVAVGGDLEWQPGGTGAVSLVVGDVSLGGK